MLILGIDPGTATTGFGVIEVDNSNDKFILLDFGWIKTDKETIPEIRLKEIHEQMDALLKKHKPDIMAIERLFFCTNVKTAISVAEACGVIRMTAAEHSIPIAQYTPMQAKCEIAGNGRADKIMMKKAVRELLSFRSPNKKKTYFDDVCDACAIAICHVRKTVVNSEGNRVPVVASVKPRKAAKRLQK